MQPDISSSSKDMQSEQLDQLPYPVYFVNKEFEKWHNILYDKFLFEDLQDLDSILGKISTGNDIWSIQTYVQLKRRGLNVYLTPSYIPGKICIAPYHYISIKDFSFNSYVVACQLDSARPELCEQRTVLNRACIRTLDDHFIPQWPQTNLKSRDPSRGTRLEFLDFKGDISCNLAKPFLSPDFLQELTSLGIQFIHSSSDPEQRLYDFSDYTNSDVIIAVRNATETDLCLKPPCKLINAWLGGCPAILGPEPAFQDLRRSELDYFEVKSPKDALLALRRLKEDPNLYRAMVENGFQRSREFAPDQVALRWHDFLGTSVAQKYEQWLRQSVVEKWVERPIKFLFRVQTHRQAHKEYLQQRNYGERLFSE